MIICPFIGVIYLSTDLRCYRCQTDEKMNIYESANNNKNHAISTGLDLFGVALNAENNGSCFVVVACEFITQLDSLSYIRIVYGLHNQGKRLANSGVVSH